MGQEELRAAPGWGWRRKKLASRLSRELLLLKSSKLLGWKPEHVCPADPGPLQKPPAARVKGQHPYTGWKSICDGVMEAGTRPAAPAHTNGASPFGGILLEHRLGFPGNGTSLCVP